jgi:hypothetical protein
MTGASRDLCTTRLRADALYVWLLYRPPPDLPRSAAILRALPELRWVSGVSRGFLLLTRRGRIDERHGTWREGFGHRIVRIVATGAVLRTAGCKLTLNDPPRQGLYPVGDTTVQRVLKVVEECADREERLPSPERLGARIGRRGTAVRLALHALHDSRQLKLIQRGARWMAELPNGRSTP